MKRLLEVDELEYSQNDEYDEEIRQFYGEKYNLPPNAFSYIINVDDDDEENQSSNPPSLKKRRIEKESSSFAYYRNGDVAIKCIDSNEEIIVNFSLSDLSNYLSKRGIKCEFTPIEEEDDSSLTEEF